MEYKKPMYKKTCNTKVEWGGGGGEDQTNKQKKKTTALSLKIETT